MIDYIRPQPYSRGFDLEPLQLACSEYGGAILPLMRPFSYVTNLSNKFTNYMLVTQTNLDECLINRNALLECTVVSDSSFLNLMIVSWWHAVPFHTPRPQLGNKHQGRSTSTRKTAFTDSPSTSFKP